MLTRISRSIRAALAVAIAAALATAAHAQPQRQPDNQPTKPAIFADLPFDKAVDSTRGNDRVLVVKFTASWCPPCRMMDRTTWVDESVIDWFKDHGTAIAVDVDEQRDLARANSIRSMPTMVAFRDGKEFDRVSGYQSPGQLVAWAEGVSNGVKAADNEELRKAEADGPFRASPMQQRMQGAQRLLEDGKHEEALAEYLWLWDNMVKQEPEMTGVRNSFLVSQIESIIAVHPPAQAAFAQRRDDLEARLKTDRRTFDDLRDWLSLNEALADNQRTLAWFDRIKSQPDSAATIRRVGFVLLDLLTENQRWADLALVLPTPAAWVARQSSGYMTGLNFMPDGANVEMMREILRRNYLSQLSLGYRAWLAAGRHSDAADMARRARQIDSDPDLASALITAALDQGVPLPEHGEWMKEAGIEGELKERWERAMRERR